MYTVTLVDVSEIYIKDLIARVIGRIVKQLVEDNKIYCEQLGSSQHAPYTQYTWDTVSVGDGCQCVCVHLNTLTCHNYAEANLFLVLLF